MLKQVLIIRKDLNMRKGKMIAQGAHAALEAALMAKNREMCINDWYKMWMDSGMTKIVVSVNSLDELADLYHVAQEADLPRSMIEDVGRTEFKEPTFTAVGIGPGPAELIDKITGALPLL
ncbi:MAG: peptidyl-tRNA hydrolase Pth2 [bacterium]